MKLVRVNQLVRLQLALEEFSEPFLNPKTSQSTSTIARARLFLELFFRYSFIALRISVKAIGFCLRAVGADPLLRRRWVDFIGSLLRFCVPAGTKVAALLWIAEKAWEYCSTTN